MVYEYTGVVEQVGETQALGNKGFSKREIIVGRDVGDPSKYPNPVKFTFKRERCAVLDGISKGARVRVSFVIDGRSWDGPRGLQYFVDLTGIKIIELSSDGESTIVPEPAEPVNKMVGYDETDDLPF